MRYGDLTYQEIAAQIKAGCLILIPTGCTEQQGPHLPVDADTWLAETACLAAAAQARATAGVETLVLPALPFGPTPEHRNYGSGYVDLPQPLHEAVLAAVLRSLAEQGCRRLVIWQGCGQHRLNRVVAAFNDRHRGRARAFLPESPYYGIWCRLGDPAVPGGHADSFLTSLALHLRPDSVRRDRIMDPRSRPVDWDDPDLDFTRYSATGVIGDPTHATAALGARLWPAVVDALAMLLQDIADQSLA